MSNDFFEIRDSEINVEDIMNQIKKAIKERNMGNMDFPDMDNLVSVEDATAGNSGFNMSDFVQNVEDINNSYNIQPDAPIRSHRKGLGKIVVFAKKVIRKCLRWYINPPFDMQREFNFNVTKNMNSLNSFIADTGHRINELEESINLLNKTIINLNEKEKRVEETAADLSSNRGVAEVFESLMHRMRNAELNLQDLNRNSKVTMNTNMVVSDRLRRIESVVKSAKNIESIKVNSAGSNEKVENVKVNAESNTGNFDIDYFMFEQLYRGSNEEIAEKQNLYLKYFQGKNNVLDIGCGRGEFVELLLKNGIAARGIDLNKDMVYFCQDKNLPVEYGNGLEYLEKLEDESLEGIFMAQVIEHLKPEQLLKLVRLAESKLKKDGIIIMETINPQCLSVFSNSFYLDMTHEKLVHPLAIKYIAEASGFSDTEIVYLSEIKDKLPAIKSSEIENLDEVNAGFNRLNQLLFGAQDYAIIARK